MNRKRVPNSRRQTSAIVMPKRWKRIALVPAVVGIILGCIAGVTVLAGDTGTGFLLLPIALLFLVFAAAIWMMLRSRNRQLRAKS